MKVRAKMTIKGFMTKGKVYDVLELCAEGDYYTINGDGVDIPRVHSDYFEIIEEEIEVGSIWLSSNNVEWKVAYVNKYVVINKDNMEICVGKEKFLEKYTPKPKTVTMCFYRDDFGSLRAVEEKLDYQAILFTREIEL